MVEVSLLWALWIGTALPADYVDHSLSAVRPAEERALQPRQVEAGPLVATIGFTLLAWHPASVKPASRPRV